MKSFTRELARKWLWLRAQKDFQRAPIRTAFRFVSWAARCALSRQTIVEIRKWNLRVLLPGVWKGIEKLIFVFRENYECELNHLETILLAGNTFVDVGANLGIYTLVASRIVGPSGRVISFEPSLQSFAQLEENISLNGFKNIMAARVALSDKTGQAFLYHGSDAGKNSLGSAPCEEPKGEVVATQSLDEALHQLSVETVDVIKMDVEGAEELVLLGANRTVALHRPIVLFEINPEASGRLGLSPHGAFDLLAASDYEFFAIKPNGSLSRLKTMPMTLTNVVAIPRGRHDHLFADRRVFSQLDRIAGPERIGIESDLAVLCRAHSAARFACYWPMHFGS
jgi:FkbM family methyltransferase